MIRKNKNLGIAKSPKKNFKVKDKTVSVLKNKNVFNSIIATSAIVTFFGLYSFYGSFKVMTENRDVKQEIEEQYSKIDNSKKEIEKISKKFKDIPLSNPQNLKNSHIILQQIIKDSNMFNIMVKLNIDVSSGNELVFNNIKSIDPESGLKKVSLIMQINYVDYKSLTNYINYIVKKYSISIEKMIMQGNSAQISISMYGDDK